MEEKFNCDLAKELLVVLAYVDDEFIKKLPDGFFGELVSLAALSDKDFFLDKDKRLCEQNLSFGCRNFLSLLYYMSVDGLKKEELLDCWSRNG